MVFFAVTVSSNANARVSTLYDHFIRVTGLAPSASEMSTSAPITPTFVIPAFASAISDKSATGTSDTLTSSDGTAVPVIRSHVSSMGRLASTRMPSVGAEVIPCVYTSKVSSPWGAPLSGFTMPSEFTTAIAKTPGSGL